MSDDLKKLADVIDHRPTRFYHSVLDPEGKVITEEGPDGTKIHVHGDLWRAFVSNSWITDPNLPKDKIFVGDKIKKPQGSARVDYNKENYCAKCEKKYPGKKKLRCTDCGNRLRTKPWHGRSNFANGGRY
jgi:DNA-directed RNA polymerase subunit RPC12/RpoP